MLFTGVWRIDAKNTGVSANHPRSPDNAEQGRANKRSHTDTLSRSGQYRRYGHTRNRLIDENVCHLVRKKSENGISAKVMNVLAPKPCSWKRVPPAKKHIPKTSTVMKTSMDKLQKRMALNTYANYSKLTRLLIRSAILALLWYMNVLWTHMTIGQPEVRTLRLRWSSQCISTDRSYRMPN